jgi:hypothetical protein
MLLFGGNIDEAAVYERLYDAGSGFKPADQQPLHSDVAVAVAVAGLVVSTAQLGIQIWRLYSEAKNAGKPLLVTVVGPTGAKTSMPADSQEAVEKALQAATAGDEPEP